MMKLFKKKPNYKDTSKYVKIISISHLSDVTPNETPGESDFDGMAEITTLKNRKLNFQRVLRHISKPIVCTTVHYHTNKDYSRIYFEGKAPEKTYDVHELEGSLREIEVGDIFEIGETYEEYKEEHNS